MIKSVKGIIVVRNNYLLQLRDNKKNVYFPNFWGVFGGRVEKAEAYHQALEREIKEETNLIVRASRMILSANCKMIGLKKKFTTVYYACTILEKRKIILTEGQKYKFFSFNQIKKLNIVPMDFAAIYSHYLTIINRKYLYKL
jgi:8-oxo-dGTP diphosphatase|tara:strand:+ start:348 stop:773 length:426 start_codon:yes stop_codon:yes gene_type:complete